MPHMSEDTHASCGSHFIFNKVLNHNRVTLFTQQLMQPYLAFSYCAGVIDATLTETRVGGKEPGPVPKDSERLPTWFKVRSHIRNGFIRKTCSVHGANFYHWYTALLFCN